MEEVKQNWIRVLKVIFTESLGGGRGHQIIYGDNYPKPDLTMSVEIHKYAAAMKDNAVITITNMPYSEVIRITKHKSYSVQIVAGYRNGNQNIVFDGAVARINNTFNRDRSNDMIIFCTSKMIARYSQKYLNYSLTSGMNTYSAIKFMCARSGLNINNVNISTQLKKEILDEAMSSSNQSLASFMNALVQNNPTYIINTDGINGSVMSIFDAARSNSRIIKIKDSQIVGGFPTVNSDGINLSVYPTFNFQCGDTIEVNNAIVNLEPVQTLHALAEQPGIYLDTSGKIDDEGNSYGLYMILSLKYSLNNRDSQFSCNINAKARSLISNYVGGAK